MDVCEYRKGKNAKYEMELIDVDFKFDKQMFIDLYNEKAQYDPVYLRNHIEECDLKLNSNSEKLNKMNDAQISIRAAYKDTYKEVIVYEYNDKNDISLLLTDKISRNFIQLKAHIFLYKKFDKTLKQAN